MPTLYDRVQVTSVTTGTGAYALGAAVSGYRAFAGACANGEVVPYAAIDPVTGEWETGLGTYASSANSLARTSIRASSNAGAAVSWSVGTRQVFITPTAADGLAALIEAAIGAGTAGQVLTSGGAGGSPGWAAGGGAVAPASATTLGGVKVPGGLVNLLDTAGTLGTREATIAAVNGASAIAFTPAAQSWIADAALLEVFGYGIKTGVGGDDGNYLLMQFYDAASPSAPTTTNYLSTGTNLYDGGTVYGAGLSSNAAVGVQVAYPQGDRICFQATVYTGRNGDQARVLARSLSQTSNHLRHYVFAGGRLDALQVAGLNFTIAGTGGGASFASGGKITVRRLA